MREVAASDGTTFRVVTAPDVSSWVTFSLTHDRRNGDVYHAHADGKVVGELRFFRGFPAPRALGIQHMGVDPDYQRRGVGSALIQQLYADNPGWTIDPGTTTEQGLAFARRLLAVEPTARAQVYPHYVEKTTGY